MFYPTKLLSCLFVMAFFHFFSLSEATYPCFCDCCFGKDCTPVPAGSITGASDCTCDSQACVEAWPKSCPIPGLGSSVATWSGKPQNCPSPWAGEWQNSNAACLSNRDCCCLSGTMISTQTGRTVIVSTPIAGGCGFLSKAEFTLTLTSPTATTASIVILGSQNINIERKGKSLTITNVGSPECSSTAKCILGECLKPVLAGWEIALIVIGSLFGAVLVGGGLYYIIHKQRANYEAL